jgi:hypothetical protein
MLILALGKAAELGAILEYYSNDTLFIGIKFCLGLPGFLSDENEVPDPKMKSILGPFWVLSDSFPRNLQLSRTKTA